MGNFIKKNLVLVAGITLPVLLIISFLILTHAPRIALEPPQYDFLVVGYRYDHQHLRNYYLNFEVKDGKLRGRVTPKDDTSTYQNQQHARIFRYDANDNSFEEISYDLPDGLEDLEKQTTFQVAETSGLSLDKKTKSPDNYSFEYLGYRGRGGLLGEVFGMGRRYDNQYVLSKNGAYFDLPQPASLPPYYYGHNLTFLGWVIADGGAP